MKNSFRREQLLQEINDSQYKQQISKFTEKIDAWHGEYCKTNSGLFLEDDEFVELGASPNKFEDSEDE